MWIPGFQNSKDPYWQSARGGGGGHVGEGFGMAERAWMIELPASRKPRQDETAGVAEHILTRIQEAAPSGVWSRIDFLDLGSSYAVEKALQRLVKRGKIRRPLRGLYDHPTKDPITGRWQIPPILSFVDAISRRDQLKFLVDGITAAHALGLTHTRPFSTIIYARARPRLLTIEAGIGHRRASTRVSYRLDFKRFSLSSPDFWAGHPAMLLVQAFHWMHDQDHDLIAGTQEVIQTLNADGTGLAVAIDVRSNMAKLPSWMRPFMLHLSDALLLRREDIVEVRTDSSLLTPPETRGRMTI